MELQWPLIIFSTFVAWSAGLFATQGVYAIKGVGNKSQLKALIVSVVILAVGGIAVFFHLEHPERMLNGFGNPTSGITQELIAIVLMGIVMVLMFAFLRRTADNPEVPKPIAIFAIITAAVLIVACGHSYMMASRPAWDSVLQIASLFGAACVAGPATFALILALDKAEPAELTTKTTFIGSIVNAVTTVAFMISMSVAGYTTFDGTYFDPTAPTKAMVDTTAIGVFSSDALVFTLITIVLTAVSVVAAAMGKKTKNWKLYGAIAAVAGVLAAIFLRIVFYVMGVSVYPYYL